MRGQRKRKKGSSYKPQEYFRGVKSSAEDISGRKKQRYNPENGSSFKAKVTGFFIVAVMIAGLLLFGYVDSANVSISGPSPYEESALSTRVQSYLDSNILRRLKPFISSSALLEHVKQTHPDVAAATISMSPISPTISVEISMRDPALIWKNADNTRLAVDVNGVAYAEFNEEFHSGLTIEVSDETQPQPALSTPVMSTQLVAFIQNLDMAVHDRTNLRSHTYKFPLSAREVQLVEKNYDIRFSLDRFEEEQAEELAELLKFLNRKKISPTNYIDLRVEDRAFYR